MTVALDTAHPATRQSHDDTQGFTPVSDLASRNGSLIAILGLVIAGLSPSSVSAQHVHGVIDLGVVIEDETLAVSIDAPLSDVVGFEHAPGNDEQSSRLKKAAAIIASADAMFGLPEAADCSVTSTEITAPDYLEALIAGEGAAGADRDPHDHEDHDHDSHGHDHEDHDHDHGSHGHDHEDHDNDHESHDHDDDSHDHDSHEHDHDSHDHGDDHDHASEHAEFNAAYQWTCRNPSALDALALSFIEGFISVQTVRVQLLTSDGAQVMNLTAKDTSLPLAGR
ncbi:MAG: DUF2796 domain-containing protein [Woeseiaceae bacterium]|nr:DUF2796 domain-containing protein [Woeseiaceae bacterium]